MRLTIRGKLIALSGLGLALVVLLASLDLWSQAQLGRRLEVMNLTAGALSYHMDVDMMQDAIRGDVLLALGAQGAADLQQANAAFSEHRQELSDRLAANARRPLSPEIATALSAFAPVAKAYVERAALLIALAASNRTQALAARASFLEAFGAVEDKADGVTALMEAANEASTRGGQAERQRALAQALTAGLAGGALLLLTALAVARSILRPLAVVAGRLREVAEGDGDLTARVDYANDDELGELARNFNTFVQKIEETVVLITGNATALAAAAEEVSAVSRQMTETSESGRALTSEAATAAGEITTSVNSVAAGVEELSSAIREIARNAAEAAGVASEAASLARDAETTVDRLGQGSAEIGQVVQSITAVAQKTNLLALNATIEAARAGEAGKGFAVVANEVKELANQAGASSDDIGRRIQNVQTQISDVVNAIRRIAEVVDQIHQRQGGIASAVEEQSAVTAEMSRGVKHAADGGVEISRIMGAAAETSQVASGAASETALAAGELARMASALQGLVGQFRTGSQSQVSPPTVRAARPVRPVGV